MGDQTLSIPKWRERNDNGYFDDSILRYAEPLAAEMDRLKALDGVGALHDQAVALHRQRCEELMQLEEYQTMRKTLQEASPYAPPEQKVRELVGLE